MFEVPQIMQDAQRLARHAGASQRQVARNMANSDTPGYQALEVKPYEVTGAQHFDLKTSPLLNKSQHIQPKTEYSPSLVKTGDPTSLNGNNVSLESEMFRSAGAQSQHSTALAVYKASLDVLRTALGRGR